MIKKLKSNIIIYMLMKEKDNFIIYILVSLVLYIGLINFDVPIFMIELFQNKLLKLIIILFILYKSDNDLNLSVFITINYLLIIHIINKQIVKEMFQCNNNNNKNML